MALAQRQEGKVETQLFTRMVEGAFGVRGRVRVEGQRITQKPRRQKYRV